jgi:hypothetical protein
MAKSESKLAALLLTDTLRPKDFGINTTPRTSPSFIPIPFGFSERPLEGLLSFFPFFFYKIIFIRFKWQQNANKKFIPALLPVMGNTTQKKNESFPVAGRCLGYLPERGYYRLSPC